MIGGLFAGRKDLPPKPGLAPRKLAVEALVNVLQARRNFDDSFMRAAASPAYAALEPRDLAFARAISASALRHAGQLRALLARFIAKSPAAPKGALDEILLAAAAQLIFLKSPPHAVIDVTVDQVKEDAAAKRYAKLTNAVLRRLSAEGPAIAAAQDAEMLNAPDWLRRRWAGAYGEEWARRIARQHMAEPPLDVTVKSEAELWAQKLGGIVLPSGSVRLAAKGRIEDLPGFQDGEWWVQDAAAALPVKLFGDVAGLAVADLCAAPGGKTAQLAAAGAHVTALDHSEARLMRLADNLERLRLKAELVKADAGEWRPQTLFDAVLVDAPCLATGTIRRNPDIALIKDERSLGALVKTQARLLAAAAAMLKPGGALVYCTCSLEPEEGERQAATFLRHNEGFRVAPVEAGVIGGHREWITPEGYLRTLPCFLQLSDPALSGMDGFFAARLIKSQG